MESCLAATGLVGPEHVLLAAILLIVVGIVLARGARRPRNRVAVAIVPLLLAGVLIGSGPALPASARGVDCPPAMDVGDSDSEGTPGTTDPDGGVGDGGCPEAQAVAIGGLFDRASDSGAFTAARFDVESGDPVALAEVLADIGPWPNVPASVEFIEGSPIGEASANVVFDDGASSILIVLLDGEVFPSGDDIRGEVTITAELPVPTGCASATLTALIAGFVAGSGGPVNCDDVPSDVTRVVATQWVLQTFDADTGAATFVGTVDAESSDYQRYLAVRDNPGVELSELGVEIGIADTAEGEPEFVRGSFEGLVVTPESVTLETEFSVPAPFDTPVITSVEFFAVYPRTPGGGCPPGEETFRLFGELPEPTPVPQPV